MDRASIILELNRSPVPQHSQDMVEQDPISLEGTTIIIMEVILSMEAMDTTMVTRGMAMEEMEINNVPILLHQ